MVSALFDTNILIDHLRGSANADQELKRYADRSISLVSWIEVVVGATGNEPATRHYFASYKILPIDHAAAERAVRLRRQYRVRLADALVWATAQVHQLLLVTRNTKDFPAGDPAVRFPYPLP